MTSYHVLLALPAETDLAPEQLKEAIATAVAPYLDDIGQPADPGERNPRATMTHYRIGGPEWGAYMPIRAGAPVEDLIDAGHSGRHTDSAFCDGGRVRALDLDRKRDEYATNAGAEWDEYAGVTADTPQHRQWSEFTARLDAAERALPRSLTQVREDAAAQVRAELGLPAEQPADALVHGDELTGRYNTAVRERQSAAVAAWKASLEYTVEQALEEYKAQPRIAALRAHQPYRNWWERWPEDVFDSYSREEFVQHARDNAVAGWATLTHDGRWMAPSSTPPPQSEETKETQAAYVAEANSYLASLPGDMVLVLLGCER